MPVCVAMCFALATRVEQSEQSFGGWLLIHDERVEWGVSGEEYSRGRNSTCEVCHLMAGVVHSFSLEPNGIHVHVHLYVYSWSTSDGC